jgi:SOS regulatory protein LexA
MQEKKQEQKKKIISFYKRNKRMPGYQEIMAMFGFKSKNSVHKLILWLVDQGVITKDSQGRIIPNRLVGDIPLLGLVEAGIPSVAEADELNTMSIEDFLVDDKDKSYLLEVKGDSMIDAHIEEGDYVLVERKNEPRIGDIVIAEVDGGWTMKYYRKDKKGREYLEPANKNYDNIYPEESFRVAAIVKAVIRKY